MADLDDFFAKKDKKKKGTKKFSKANTDVIAKNLEESAIKEQKQQDKEMTNMGEDKNPEKINQQDDDEWDDYRENKKDYTGLKIENLVIEEPVKVEEEETEINEDGEVVKVKKDESAAEDSAPKGAWGKTQATQHRGSDGPKLTLGNKFDALRDE